jgi:DNA-binding NtrC family response regulator
MDSKLNRHSVLLVSDDSSLIDSVQRAVQSVRGCRISVAGTGLDIQSELDSVEPVLLVYHAAGNGTDVPESLLEHPFLRKNPVAVLVVRDRHDGEAIAKLLRLGVTDVLVRPLDLRRLVFLIETLTLRARYTPQAAPAVADGRTASDSSILACNAPAIAPVIDRLRRVAQTDATVLLTGETGSGKSWFAKRVHDDSPRASKTFFVVNCGALSPSLIESELFGHCKGAFSGAEGDRIGKLEAAGDGSLFLDDVDALPLELQGRLLRSIDERVFEKVGSNRLQEVRARIIVATNKHLPREVAANRFREDLYFRLNVVEFRLPPLRSRREDILPLATGFLNRFASQYGRPAPKLPPELCEALESYDWPGNIRQLRNAMERVVTLSEGVVRVEDLPIELQGCETAQPDAMPVRHGSSLAIGDDDAMSDAPQELSDSDLLDSSVHTWVKPLSSLARARLRGEIRRILEALDVSGNNRAQAARNLGISRVALYKKLHKYGLMDVAGE